MEDEEPPHPDTQFEIEAEVTLRVRVTVDALTEDEARQKFDALDWADDGYGGAQTTNWRAVSAPTQSYP